MKIRIKAAKSDTLRNDARGATEALSSKLQAPGSREIPSSKHEMVTRGYDWSLKLGAFLELGAWNLELSSPRARRAFTLLEVLLALLILGMVLAVVHAIFHGALQLRNQADRAFEASIPLQHAVSVIKRDLANLTVPGGTLSGTFQTTLTTGSSATSTTHGGQQVGPVLYTASGSLSDADAWSEMRKVTYYLMPSTGNGPGLDLVRSVTRNLLPVTQDEYADQILLSGVDDVTLQYYNGTQWMDAWDSTATSTTTGATNTLPSGIRVQIALAAETGQRAPEPIELVVPISVQVSTNTASTTGGGG